jgi:hypothetical protein
MRVEAEKGAGEGGVGHEIWREGAQINGVAARAFVALWRPPFATRRQIKYSNSGQKGRHPSALHVLLVRTLSTGLRWKIKICIGCVFGCIGTCCSVGRSHGRGVRPRLDYRYPSSATMHRRHRAAHEDIPKLNLAWAYYFH